ncbi:kinetoplast DNA-associated protein, partial [Trypanosoma cruzi]
MLNVRRLIFFALLFLHGAVSETGVFPRRCHIDSNHFLAKSISRGEWIGIEYDITYLKGMCDTDDRNGILSASINGRNKSLKAREGFIAFDNVATVHFNLTSGKKGVQLFSSQICWSSANCTALCSSEPLGIVSSCTVGNIMDSLAILLFFVVPLFVCSFALLVCYARVKILRRRGMLAFREQHRQEDISPAAAFEKNRKPRYDNFADINPANSVETAVCEVTMVQGDGETTTREAGDMNDSARSNSVKKDITNECERKPFEVFFLRENKNICEEEKSGALQQDNAIQTIVDITRDIKKNDNHALHYTHFRSTDSPYICNAREKTKHESTEAVINTFQLKEELVQHGVAEEEAARRMHGMAEEEAARRMHEVAEEEAARRMHEVAEEEAARRMHEVAEEGAARRMHEVAEEEAARRMHEVAEEEA